MLNSEYLAYLKNCQLVESFLNPAHLPVDQPHLDAVGMTGRFRQDVPDNPPCQSAGTLVLFQHNINGYSGEYIPPVPSIHQVPSLAVENPMQNDSLIVIGYLSERTGILSI